MKFSHNSETHRPKELKFHFVFVFDYRMPHTKFQLDCLKSQNNCGACENAIGAPVLRPSVD